MSYYSDAKKIVGFMLNTGYNVKIYINGYLTDRLSVRLEDKLKFSFVPGNYYQKNYQRNKNLKKKK